MSDEKKPSPTVSENTSRTVIVTGDGVNIEYKRTKKTENRTRVSILTVHFDGVPGSEKESVAITSEIIRFDRRANSEHHIKVRWSVERGYQYTAEESITDRGGNGEITEKRVTSINAGTFKVLFDNAAVKAAHLLDSPDATIKFLVKYLPKEFVLEL